MVNKLENLDAFLNYNLDVSARYSEQALGVVKRENAAGERVEVLAIVDLKVASLWDKIVLWWNGSLSKRTVGLFLSQNIQAWSDSVAKDHKRLVTLEKQCAKLSRKIHFSNAPTWKLDVEIQYPTTPGSQATKTHTTISVDRLTSNIAIYNQLDALRAKMVMHGRDIYPRLMHVFADHAFTGAYKGERQGALLKDSDKGHDRTAVLKLSQPHDANLMSYYDKAVKAEVRPAAYYVPYVPVPQAVFVQRHHHHRHPRW